MLTMWNGIMSYPSSSQKTVGVTSLTHTSTVAKMSLHPDGSNCASGNGSGNKASSLRPFHTSLFQGFRTQKLHTSISEFQSFLVSALLSLRVAVADSKSSIGVLATSL